MSKIKSLLSKLDVSDWIGIFTIASLTTIFVEGGRRFNQEPVRYTPDQSILEGTSTNTLNNPYNSEYILPLN